MDPILNKNQRDILTKTNKLCPFVEISMNIKLFITKKKQKPKGQKKG